MTAVQTDGGSPRFLDGGGECGALMRALDRSKTPLGPTAAWPQSLPLDLPALYAVLGEDGSALPA